MDRKSIPNHFLDRIVPCCIFFSHFLGHEKFRETWPLAPYKYKGKSLQIAIFKI